MENHRNSPLGVYLFTIIVGTLLLICGFLLSCSQQTTPSLLTQLDTPAALPARPMSDIDIIRYGEGIKGKWGMRSLNAEWFNTGTQITLAGLSTATVAIASRGTGGSAASVVPSVGAFLLQTLGIIKPGERETILSEGSGLILDGETAYFECMRAAGEKLVPTDHVSDCGWPLAGSINSAVKVTNNMLAGIIPKPTDVLKAQGLPQTQVSEVMRATIP